jgi:TctA family transporter
MIENMISAFGMVFQPDVLLIMVLASIYGLFVGAMPGLTATMATALLVPVTFFMEPVPALAAIITMEAMAIFAGDIPGALIRIPGTPASAAYTDESYALALKGRGSYALLVSLIVSVIGGLFGSVVLILLAAPLAEYALNFSSYEYFWMMSIGLGCAVLVCGKSFVKGMTSLLLGLFLTTIGIDITIGFPRFTFGSTDLFDGISYIPAMIGMFGICQILKNISDGKTANLGTAVRTEPLREAWRDIWPTLKRYKWNQLRSNAIGTFIGILPGAGGDVAAWVTFSISKRFSKEPEKFGTGHIEGLVDASAANNAAVSGAWVPALVFGIPGDSITAIVIGVMFMKGIRPGPMIFHEMPQFLYALYIIFILSNILLIPFGIAAIKAGSQMLKVPQNILMPIILLFCIVGCFAISNTLFDVVIMLVLGVLGYFMEKNDFPVAPAILGMVLGRMLEENFMRSMMKSGGDLTEFFVRPGCIVLASISILLWITPLIQYFWKRAIRGGKIA